MSEKITGIVLNVRKYNDKNSIVTLFTRERGRLVFISPSGSGKASNVRRARLQPLSVVTTDLNFKNGVELQRLGSISSAEIWTDIYFNPSKRALALFISEFLYRLIYATMPDPHLFDFILSSVRLLDRMQTGIADFHIPFLIALLSFSGIQPDVSDIRPGYVFEFQSGTFVPEFEAKTPFIAGTEAEIIPWLLRLNFANMKCLRLNALNRRQILYGLLNYFSFHFPGLVSLKSPEVLREIFESN